MERKDKIQETKHVKKRRGDAERRKERKRTSKQRKHQTWSTIVY